LSGTPSDEDFVEAAKEIVEQAQRQKVPIRVMGGCAIRIHCANHLKLHQADMQRHIPDLDFLTLAKYRPSLKETLKNLGYRSEVTMVGMPRDTYLNDEKAIHLDIFFDKLKMCHTIDFENRLENDFPTLSLADLLLTKLQVVEINEKDVKDVLVLLLEHDLGESDKETVDTRYITKLLSNDWGFYYTVTTNLNKIRNIATERYADMLTPQDLETILSRIQSFLSRIEKAPKSTKWKMREKIGTKKLWYSEVEEVAMGTVTEYIMKKNAEQKEKLGH
jgi:hypothetical protein